MDDDDKTYTLELKGEELEATIEALRYVDSKRKPLVGQQRSRAQ